MEVRNSDGRIPSQEPPKATPSWRDALIVHMRSRPGGMTSQDLEDLDRDYPVPTDLKPSLFGHIGGGGHSVPIGDPGVPRDHADWLARKEEILKEAFPNDPRYRNHY